MLWLEYDLSITQEWSEVDVQAVSWFVRSINAAARITAFNLAVICSLRFTNVLARSDYRAGQGFHMGPSCLPSQFLYCTGLHVHVEEQQSFVLPWV